MNFTYLDNKFQTDDRAVLIYPIRDYTHGLILEVGTEIKVIDIMLDPHMPSGYAVLFHIENSGRDYLVDKDFLMAYTDYVVLYNKFLEKVVLRGRL